MYVFKTVCKGTHFFQKNQDIFWIFQKNIVPLHTQNAKESSISIDSPHARQMRARSLLFSHIRRVGRVIDRAGLEIRYTLFGYRGFESLTLRKNKQKGTVWFPFILDLTR